MSSDLRSEASSGTLSKSKSGAKTSVDVSEGTKRRNDQTVSLRKKTRLEQLSKKRKEDSDNENDNSEAYIAETTAMFERLGDYVSMMDKSNTIEVVGEGVAAIRRMLCHPERNPMRELIQLGGLDKLISCLDAPDPAIQFNAAWSLTNISSFAQSNAQLIISLGAIPRFINFLQHPVEKLREQAAWCLGNMAGDGAQVRDEILNAGVMSPLLECLNGENDNIATMRNACWLLAQLVRNKPSPAFETVECCLPTLRNLLEHPVSEIQDDACWAVSYISDGPPSRINAVMSYGVMPIIYDLLKSGRETVLLPSVRTFGNFTATNPEMTQIVIDQGVLNFLPPLLHPKVSRQIRKEVCWLISNACAGYDSQVEAVINADLFPPVVNNMYASEFEVRREAVWVVANATATASVERIRFLVEACDVLGGLCNVLATMDSRICNIALESIEAILLVGDQFRGSNDGRNPYADHIESIGGRDNIGRLRDHICHTVFLRSATIMDRYFDDGWNADEFGPNDGNNNDDDGDDNNNDGDGDNNDGDDGNSGNTNNQPQQQGNRSNNNNNNGNDRISF